MTFKLAACVLMPTGNRPEEIIAISRRNDFTKWGIPGGKQDDDETNVRCAMREIREETGIQLLTSDLVPIYSGACYGKDGHDFWVTTYVVNDTFSGIITNCEDGLQCKPMELITLCNESISPFAPYNINVLTAWRHFKCWNV